MKLESIDFDIRIEGSSIKKDIMPLYLNGETIPDIAKVFCIRDYDKLRNLINEYIKAVKGKIQNQRIEAIHPEDIFELKKQGKSTAQIRALYNLSPAEVEKIFKKYCEENNIDRKQFHRSKLENVDSEEILKKLEAGMTLEKLGHEYNVSSPAIRNRILQVVSEKQLKEIFIKNRTKKYMPEDKAYEIFELYKKGISREELAKKFNCSIAVITNVLSKEYGKVGIKRVPKIISKQSFLKKVNKKNYKREELLKEAEELNIVIPQEFLDEHFGPEDIDIIAVGKFVIGQFSNIELEEDKKNQLFRSFNVAKTLKENDLSIKHQAVALIYLLPTVVGTPIEEIDKVLNNNKTVIESLEILLSDDTNQIEYLQKLKHCRYALEVKLAIVLEEIREHTLRKEKINISHYKEYIKQAKFTKLKNEYELALMENEKINKGNDR